MAVSVCEIFPNLRDRVTKLTKTKSIEDVWISSVRSVLSSTYRLQKFRGTIQSKYSNCHLLIIYKAKVLSKSPSEELMDYKNLRISSIRNLLQQSFIERNIDRQELSLTDFLAKWPCLKEQEHLRREYKIQRGAKNLDFMVKRMTRLLPSILYL